MRTPSEGFRALATGAPTEYQAPPRTPPAGGSGGSDAQPEVPQFRFAFTATIQHKRWNGYGDVWEIHQSGQNKAEVTVVAPTLEAAEAKATPLLYALARDYRWGLKAHTIEEVQ